MSKIEVLNNTQTEITREDARKHGKLVDGTRNISGLKVDGVFLLQDEDSEESLTHVLMSENYFVDNWLTQFAIDKVNGVNYFDINTWSDITDNLTKAVLVVDDTPQKNILFLIPKFTEMRVSDEGRALIERYVNFSAQVKNLKPEEIEPVVLELSVIIDSVMNAERTNTGLTGLIPDFMYERYGIVPKSMKAMIYIRDTFNLEPDTEVFHKVSEVLNRYFTNKPISLDEKNLVLKVTNNQFNFEDKEPSKEEIQTATDNIPENPFID